MHPKAGHLVVFAGDSLTEHLVAVSEAMETQMADLPEVGSMVRVDRHENRGWVDLLVARITIRQPGNELRFLNAGRGGDTSRLLLERLSNDVLIHRPDWCLISIGLVDVRRSFQPERAAEAVPLEEYRANLRKITRQLQENDVRVLLLEPTPHSRPPTGADKNIELRAVNEATQTYGAAMAEVASECRVGLVRLFEPVARLERRLSAKSSPATLYADEVHLNRIGDFLYSQLVFDWLSNDWSLPTQLAT